MANPLRKLGSGVLKRVNALRGQVSLAHRHGAVFVLAKDNWIDARLLARRPFEDAQIARFRARLNADRFDLVLDIGANFGLYAIMAGVGGVRSVHAFEPVARNHHQLCANIFANRIDDRVTAHRIALSDSTGETSIQIDPRSTGTSRLGEAGDRATAAHFSRSEAVTLQRFDDAFAFTNQRAYVKVDVEGHEQAVLRGMTQFLTANRVELQVEAFTDTQAEVRDQLAVLGYRHLETIEHDLYFTNAPA